eukprot:1841591-Prymnesium_polylepis.1
MVDENLMLPPELHLDDANTHACLWIAAQREDVARATCTKARAPPRAPAAPTRHALPMLRSRCGADR